MSESDNMSFVTYTSNKCLVILFGYVSCYYTKQYSSVTCSPLRMVLHYSELEFVFVFSYSDGSIAYQSQISMLSFP